MHTNLQSQVLKLGNNEINKVVLQVLQWEDRGREGKCDHAQHHNADMQGGEHETKYYFYKTLKAYYNTNKVFYVFSGKTIM